MGEREDDPAAFGATIVAMAMMVGGALPFPGYIRFIGWYGGMAIFAYLLLGLVVGKIRKWL